MRSPCDALRQRWWDEAFATHSPNDRSPPQRWSTLLAPLVNQVDVTRSKVHRTAGSGRIRVVCFAGLVESLIALGRHSGELVEHAIKVAKISEPKFVSHFLDRILAAPQ